MLKALLALLPTLQLGARVKTAVERGIRQAIFIAAAMLFLLYAILFGLFAAYLALHRVWNFTPLESAGIVAATLLLIALLILGLMPIFTREKKRKKRRGRHFDSGDVAQRAVTVAHNQVGDVIQKLGPAGVLSAAFVLGLIFGRRR